MSLVLVGVDIPIMDLINKRVSTIKFKLGVDSGTHLKVENMVSNVIFFYKELPIVRSCIKSCNLTLFSNFY